MTTTRGYFAAEPIAEIKAVTEALCALHVDATPVIDMGGHTITIRPADGTYAMAAPGSNVGEDGWALLFFPDEDAMVDCLATRTVTDVVRDAAAPADVAAALAALLPAV